MRYDTEVFFQRIKQGEYDPTTGDYAPDTVEEVKRYASVTDSGADTINIVYGEIRQGIKTVRLQNHYTEPFDRVRIGNKAYRVDFSKAYRTKHTLVVSEVQ